MKKLIISTLLLLNSFFSFSQDVIKFNDSSNSKTEYVQIVKIIYVSDTYLYFYELDDTLKTIKTANLQQLAEFQYNSIELGENHKIIQEDSLLFVNYALKNKIAIVYPLKWNKPFSVDLITTKSGKNFKTKIINKDEEYVTFALVDEYNNLTKPFQKYLIESISNIQLNTNYFNNNSNVNNNFEVLKGNLKLQSNALIKTNAGTFTMPTEGTLLTEVAFTPFAGGAGLFSLPSILKNLDILGVKTRYFYDNNHAFRFLGNLSLKSSGVEGEKAEIKIGLSLGLEKHLIAAERLSTYLGYDVNIGFKSNQEAQSSGLGSPTLTTKNTLGFGANVFTGFDYYIMPRIYMGVEVSYGLTITKTKYENMNAVTSLELAPGVSSFLRLGWKF